LADGTAFAFKCNIDDAIILYFEFECNLIAAEGIDVMIMDVGVVKMTFVSGIPVMVKDVFAV